MAVTSISGGYAEMKRTLLIDFEFPKVPKPCALFRLSVERALSHVGLLL